MRGCSPLAILAVVLLLAACGPSPAELAAQATSVAATCTAAAPTLAPLPIDQLRPLFDYDAAAPLDIAEVGVEYRGEVAVHDISYASPLGGRVTAYLVVPPGAGPFAAVLFHHPGDGSRASMLEEAITLANYGVVGLLIDAPWARPEPWRRELNYVPENDRAVLIQNVVDMRRGIDLLVARQDVDRERIGFIGYSYGAHMGGVLSGVETRVRAYVFMAGMPSYRERIPSHIAAALSAEHLAAYRTLVGPLDAFRYVGHAAPAALLYQCARHDEILDEALSLRFYEAGSEPKEIMWYDAGHSLNEQAFADRLQWLGEHLGFLTTTQD